ncbi:EGF-like domain-containing protein [Ditylenchus destructor]|nr:EGF-like domain-containing protein [Ditylenchus destructor]
MNLVVDEINQPIRVYNELFKIDTTNCLSQWDQCPQAQRMEAHSKNAQRAASALFDTSKRVLIIVILFLHSAKCLSTREGCPSNICLNNGICWVNKADNLNPEFECECHPGYTGDLCELPHSTTVKPCTLECQNGGSCVSASPATEEHCECPQEVADCRTVPCSLSQICLFDLTTQRFGCEHDLCIENPCANNATCRPLKGNFFCECVQGLKGKLCEEDVDECLLDAPVCRNGGTCVNHMGGFSCKCPAGFGGTVCEQSNGFCHQNPCRGHGECQELPDSYKCHCFANFTGRNCESEPTTKFSQACDKSHQLVINSDGGNPECICREGMTGEKCNVPIDLCNSSKICQNGGECVSNSNRVFCICPSKFIGEHCEIPIEECTVDGWNDVKKSTFCKCRENFGGKWCDRITLSAKPIDQISGLTQTNSTTPTNSASDCPHDYCKNGGVCYRSSPHEVFSSNEHSEEFACRCPDNTSGTFCETVLSDNETKCASDSCLNGGICISHTDSNEGFTCSCPNEFVGQKCEIECNCAEGLTCHESPTQQGIAQCYRVNSSSELGHSSTLTPSDVDNKETFTSFPKPSPELTLDANSQTNDHLTTDTNQESHTTPWSMVQTFLNVSSCAECMNAAKCINAGGQISCLCTKDYVGHICDVKKSHCDTFPTCSEPGHVCRLKRNDAITAIPYCDCPAGTMGPSCKQPAVVTFANSSVLIETIFHLPNSHADFSLEFSYRTTLPNAHFVTGESILGKEEFSMGLRNGRFALNLSDSTQFPDLFGVLLNDGDWYTVRLVNTLIEGTAVELLHSDTGYILMRRNFGSLKFSSMFTIRFGRKVEGMHFAGCLRDVKLSNKSVDLLNSERSVDVLPGCIRRKQCDIKRCQNGAVCIDLWNDFRCECPRPLTGRLCEFAIPEATFGYSNQSTLVEFTLDHKTSAFVSMNTDVSFLIRTKSRRATIFYLGEKNDEDLGTFLSGRLRVNARLGGKKVYTLTSDNKINDNKQHLVGVVRHENIIKIKIDDGAEEILEINRPFSHPLLANTLAIGDKVVDVHSGNGNISATDVPYFKGTLQDMRINARHVNLVNTSAMWLEQFGVKSFEKNLLEGMVSDDVCAEMNPCKHGQCTNTFNDFVCKCDAGWISSLCDHKDYCGSTDSLCPEGTTCINSNGGFVCVSEGTFAHTSSMKYFLRMPSDHPPPKVTNLTFEIRTRSGNNSILKLQSTTDSLLMEMRGSQLIFTHSNKTNTQLFSTPQNRTNLGGEWHAILLLEKDQKLFVGIDSTVQLTQIPLSFILKRFALDRNSQITFGRTQNSSSFKGCLRNVRVGSLPPLSFLAKEQMEMWNSLASVPHFTTVSRQNVRYNGCRSTEVCGLANPCKNKAACVDLFNAKQCDCLAGFEGEFCEINTDDCKAANGTSTKDLCGKNAICVDGINTYSCQCLYGFSGQDCRIVEDKCAKNPCLNGGKCNTINGEYHCACPTHFIGRHCQAEKSGTKCSDDPCHNGGKCIETELGVVKCLCADERYTGDLCDIPKNYCADMPCKHGGVCKSADDGSANFTCECKDSFQGDSFCSFTDICAAERPCQNNAKCENIFEEFLCHCKPGWKGSVCNIDVNECEEDMPCENNGACTNTPGGFICQCPKFYMGDRCEVAGICAREPCQNDGECIQLSATEHTCKCAKGFTGELCEEQINYCLQEPCRNGATCHPLIGSFECSCIAGFTGKACETDIDDCASHFCSNNGTCIDRVNGFECDCSETGYKGPQCLDDIDECLEPTNCVHGSCTNTPGNWHCNCMTGYIGKRCHMVDPCVPNSQNKTLHNCAHGKCVRPVVIKQLSGREVTQHDCECDKGYAGPSCTVLVQASKSVALGYIIGPVAVVLLVLCIVGVMLFFIVASKKRANQGTYSPSTQEMTGATVAVNKSRKEGFSY